MSLIPTTVSPRESRAVALQSGAPMAAYGERRPCRVPECASLLSRYNPADTCGVHRGWGGSPTPRRRR